MLSSDWLPSYAGSGRKVVAVVELEAVKDSLEPRSLALPPVVGMLEQAEEFQRLVMSGIVASRAELARRHGITRGRVTQVMSMLELHPLVLAFVRSLPGGTGPRLVTERKLRRLTHLSRECQVNAALEQLPGFAGFMASLDWLCRCEPDG